MSPREAGVHAGRQLAFRVDALASVVSQLEIDDRRRAGEVQSLLSAKALERENSAEAVRRIETRSALLADRLAELTRDRAAEPAKYSVPRSVLFLGLGICAVVGDLAFLGTILATLVGSPVVTNTGDSIAKVLLTDPRAALNTFPEVTLLALSVLTSGFVMKLWYQHATSRSGPASKAWFWFVSGGLVLALSVLLLISGVRLQLPLDGGIDRFDTRLARFATAALGLSLPLVAAFFLTEGIDALGRRFELWRMSAANMLVGRSLKAAKASETMLASTVAELQGRIDSMSDPKAIAALRRVTASEFECGYQEGATSCLSSGKDGALFERLRAVTMARLARETAQ